MAAAQAGEDDGSGNPCEQNIAPMSGGAAAAAPPDIGLIKSSASPDACAGAVVNDTDDPTQLATLAGLAQQCLQTEVFGVQAQGTFDGKAHDLSTFVRWFEGANGHEKLHR